MYLEYFLHYGSVLAGTVALACAGLASWRLSKVLHERSFAIAAWAMGGFVVLDAAFHTVDWLYGFLPRAIVMQWISLRMQVYHVASLCLFVFFAAFFVGAIRRSLMAKKLAEPKSGPVASGD